MSDQDYFNSPAIGSSLLGTVITRTEPLQICLDLATISVKPTSFMETGKMFEDLVEEEFSGKPVFSDKYFHSSIQSIPTTSKKDLKDILKMLDGECWKEDENGVSYNTLHRDVQEGYVLKKDGTWNSTYSNRNQCFKEMQAHDYRRPVPEPTWDKLQIMLKRFKNYPFKIGEVPKTLWAWQTLVNIDFQVEYFWKHESGAECRAKFDMIWTWKTSDGTYAMPFDLKVTGNWPSFESNWKFRYIWQTKHYIEGFMKYCAENNLIPHLQMWYLIQESAAPQIAHARALSVEEIDRLSTPYDEAIPLIWEWIEAGKPIKGYVEQQIVDRWGRVE